MGDIANILSIRCSISKAPTMSRNCLTPLSSSLTFCKTRTNIQKERLLFSSSTIHFPLHHQFLGVSFSHPLPCHFHNNNKYNQISMALSRALDEYMEGDEYADEDSPIMTSSMSLSLDEYMNGAEFSDEDSPAITSSSSPSCRLYVCNLPRSCDISELLSIFKPYGTVQSVEVSRNSATGISRGCGHVTMSSLDEAKSAISALDASDVGGREMRVMFADAMNKGSVPSKNLIFESPHKAYVGNLAHTVTPRDIRNLFSQFGTVVSSRVLHDSKSGKNRVYGFVSFSLFVELERAISLDGTDFCGRKLVVREASGNKKR